MLGGTTCSVLRTLVGGYPHLMNASIHDSPQRIESLTNPLVKELRALRTHKGRVEQRRFMAEGERSLAEAAAAGWRAEYLFVAPGAVRGVVPATRIIDVSLEVLEKITGRDNPQPHLGVFAEPDAASRDLGELNARSAARWLMIEAPRDPGNLGSCIRSADATAAGGIILVGDACDPYSIECVRATMGSIFAVQIFRVTRDEAIELLARWPGESAPTGWIAEARASGRATRSCVAAAPPLTCAISGLDAGTKYSVRLRAYSVPAGPSPRTTAVQVTTKR